MHPPSLAARGSPLQAAAIARAADGSAVTGWMVGAPVDVVAGDGGDTERSVGRERGGAEGRLAGREFDAGRTAAAGEQEHCDE